MEMSKDSEMWLENAIKNEHITSYRYGSFVDFKPIGRGACGTVFRARSNDYQKIMALKELNHELTVDEFVNELKQHRKVESHDNIIRFYGITKKEKSYMLVLEYADGGTLDIYLKKNQLPWDVKLNLGKQIASAVACLHANGIVHRDLHSGNVLIHHGAIKLGDFGIAKRTIDPTNAKTKALGSIKYSDPRCFFDRTYRRGKKSDTYSVGALLWQISSGKIPFEMHSADILLMNSISSGEREKPVKGTPKKYVEIYTDCWQDDPEKRPDLFKVVEELEKVDINVLTEDYTSGIENNTHQSTDDWSNEVASRNMSVLIGDINEVASRNMSVSIGDLSGDINEVASRNMSVSIGDHNGDVNGVSSRNTSVSIGDYGGNINEVASRNMSVSIGDINEVSSRNTSVSIGDYDRDINEVASRDMSVLLDGDINDNVISQTFNEDEYLIPATLASDDLKNSQQLINSSPLINKSKKEIIDKIIKENFNDLRATKISAVSNDIQKSIEEENATSSEIFEELINIQETSPVYLTLIGFFYLRGIGTSIDEDKSFEYFTKSNNLKESTGQAWLGYLFEYGIGVKHNNIKRAFELFYDSANQNNAFGQYYAGLCYKSGKGISRNTCEATKLFERALKNGELKAKPHLEELERLKRLNIERKNRANLN